MKLRILRATDEVGEPQEMIERTLEQVGRTYETLAALAFVAGGDDRMTTMLAQAQRANDMMLAHLRHPSGGC